MLISRRECLKLLAGLGTGAITSALLGRLLENDRVFAADKELLEPARYWQKTDNGAVRCNLCPHRETIPKDSVGICMTRQNVGGRLITLANDRPCIINIDAIEKNPLAHVLPGANMLAVAHAGCNLRCQYCQNWQFSQRKPTDTDNVQNFKRSEAIAKAAARDIRGLSFTYTEPAVTPEFVRQMAGQARDKGLINTMCTCGYILPKPFKELLASFKAVTITYKGATETFYQEVCGCSMKPVLDAMLCAKEENKWLEVATLIVPGMNDNDTGLRTQAAWISKNLGPDTPWHVERFSPMFKLTKLSPTPQATLERARQIGMDAGLRFVYTSNIAPHDGNHTYCPGCHKPVIQRMGFKLLALEVQKGRCIHCQQQIPGIWS